MNGRVVARRVQIDPWGSSQFQDYARLRDQFGISPFGPEEAGTFDPPHALMRRGVIFGHRDFERVAEARRARDPWSMMTGFMPSGDLHLGHKMLMDQVVFHAEAGADVHLAVADLEVVAARGIPLAKAREIAIDQYVRNALALGLDPSRAEFYFQSRRHRVRDLAQRFGQKLNWSTLQALYGFGGETSLAHVMAPLVQAADILHVQDDDVGPRPVLVPVGVDQDPHVRLTRDIAQAWRIYNVQETDEGLGIFVKPDDDVSALLDRAEAAVRGQGYGELKRNDRYKALYVKGAAPSDLRRIDLALAQTEREVSAGDGPTGPPMLRPSATFHRFLTGLDGGKMSSSRPESHIALTEDPASAVKKLRHAVTGGRASAEEQRRLGADPEKCPVYELYLYHLAPDDADLQRVHDECKGGQRLCGGCKSEAAERLVAMLQDVREKRDATEHLVSEIVRAE